MIFKKSVNIFSNHFPQINRVPICGIHMIQSYKIRFRFTLLSHWSAITCLSPTIRGKCENNFSASKKKIYLCISYAACNNCVFVCFKSLSLFTYPEWNYTLTQHNLDNLHWICKATLTHERGSGAPLCSNDSIIRPKCCLLANLYIRLPKRGQATSICLRRVFLPVCPLARLSLPTPVCNRSSVAVKQFFAPFLRHLAVCPPALVRLLKRRTGWWDVETQSGGCLQRICIHAV